MEALIEDLRFLRSQLRTVALRSVDGRYLSKRSKYKTEKSMRHHHKAFSGSSASGHPFSERTQPGGMQLLWEEDYHSKIMASNRKFLLLCAFVASTVAGTHLNRISQGLFQKVLFYETRYCLKKFKCPQITKVFRWFFGKY